MERQVAKLEIALAKRRGVRTSLVIDNRRKPAAGWPP
jgi:hypothetical protein